MKKLRAVMMLASTIASFVLVASARPEKSSKSADQIMSRYARNTRALRRFVCTMEVQVHGFGSSLSLNRIEKVRVAYDGPRRIAVRELSFTVSGPDGRDKEAFAYPRYYNEIIADGNRYYALDAYQKQYVLHKLHAKGFAAETQGAGMFSDFSFGDLLLSSGGKEAVAPFTGGKIVGDRVLDSTVCDKVQFSKSIEMPDGTREKEKYIYWISRKDGLLRRLETKSPSMRLIESYSIQNVGSVISQSEFVIKPPATAKRVNSL